MRMKKIRKRLRIFNKALKMEIREHKSSFLVYVVLRAAVIVTMILQLLNRNYENVFLCVLTLLLLVIPSLTQMTFRIELPKALEITILIFIFAAEILGEINEFYILFPEWDTILHTLNGFLAAAIGYSMIHLLNRSERAGISLSPLYLALVSFCFSMTIGVVWEFFEFAMDSVLGFDMQKDSVIQTIHSVLLNPSGENIPKTLDHISEVLVNGQALGVGGYLDIGLIDTMADLFVNFVGAFVFSVIGYFYAKNRNKKSIAREFIPRRKEEDRDFLTIARREGEKGEEK